MTDKAADIHHGASAGTEQQRGAAQAADHAPRPRPGRTGSGGSTTSCSTSTKMPPRPTMATGPNTGSWWMPRMHSTPPVELLGHQHALGAGARRALGRAGQQRGEPRPHRQPASVTPSSTPPISVLCDDVGRQDLEHDREADALRRRHRGIRIGAGAFGRAGDAGRGQQAFGPGLVRRACRQLRTRDLAAPASPARRRTRRPSRPMAAMAFTARVGSSNTVQPSAS